MVISRTPLRVSFVGGGSDLVSFSSQQRRRGRLDGDRQVRLRRRHRALRGRHPRQLHEDRDRRLASTSSSTSSCASRCGSRGSRTASRSSRLPTFRRSGTGLGSSSAVTVGALNALYAFQGILKPGAAACRGRLPTSRSTSSASRSGSRISTPRRSAGCNCCASAPATTSHRDPVVLAGRREASARAEPARVLYRDSSAPPPKILKRASMHRRRPRHAAQPRQPARPRARALRRARQGRPRYSRRVPAPGWEQKRQAVGRDEPEDRGLVRRPRARPAHSAVSSSARGRRLPPLLRAARPARRVRKALSGAARDADRARARWDAHHPGSGDELPRLDGARSDPLSRIVLAYFARLKTAIDHVPIERIEAMGEILYRAYRHGKQVFIIGNGAAPRRPPTWRAISARTRSRRTSPASAS